MAKRERGGRWADIEVFCRAAEAGRFVAAAEALAIAPSAVSRAILRLEVRLGVPLFTRTTRRVTLTQEGALFFQQCRLSLGQIEDAERALAGAAQRVVGRLRLAVPTTYGPLRLLPRMPAFQALHPDLQIEVHVTNRVIDMVEEGFDVAVRLGDQPASSLLSRTLERGTIGLFAARPYLDRHGEPGSIAGLAAHVGVGFVLAGQSQPMDWEFLVEGERRFVRPPRGPVSVHDPMGMVALGRAGAGLFQTGHYVVADDLRSGAVVEVLKAFAGLSRPIIALFPANRRLSPKVRAFLDFFGRPG